MTVLKAAVSVLLGVGTSTDPSGISTILMHRGFTACFSSVRLKGRRALFCLRFPLVTILAVPTLPVIAGDTALDRETLRGLTSIKIVVEQLTPDLESAGLTRDQLQSDIEKQVREAGISVDSNATEFLGIEMISARLKYGLTNVLNVAFKIAVFQVVTLNRNKASKTVAETWSGLSVQASPPKMAARVSRETVAKLVDQFITAYREVNAAGARREEAEANGVPGRRSLPWAFRSGRRHNPFVTR